MSFRPRSASTQGQVDELQSGSDHHRLRTIVTPAALQFILAVMLFLGTLFFFILGRASFRSHAVNWFTDREARLRTLKIMNDIESNLGGYLIVVTAINLGLGIATTIMAYLMGSAVADSLGRVGFRPQLHSLCRPRHHGRPAVRRRPLDVPNPARRVAAAGGISGDHHRRRPIPHAGDRRPPGAQPASAGDFSQHRILGLAVGTGRRVPCDADPDHRARGVQPSLSAATRRNCRGSLYLRQRRGLRSTTRRKLRRARRSRRRARRARSSSRFDRRRR